MTRAKRRPRPAPKKPPAVLRWIKEAPKAAAALGAVVGLIAGILGLIAWFSPDSKPTSRGPTDAQLEILDFRRHMTLGEYLRMIHRERGGYSPEQLRRDGVVATVRAVHVSGVKRADLYSTVRDSASGSNVANDHFVDRLVAHFKIRTNGDSGGSPFWVEAPAQSGSYFVYFELKAPNGSLLNSTKSDPFVVG